jgi:tetratricopeptide (TPR) repeat protein
MPEADKEDARQEYRSALQRQARLRSPEFAEAPQELANTVHDLERRGLIQYDHLSKRYDLHPVVRGVTTGGVPQEDKDRFGKRVVDYFSQQTHVPYAQAETLDDLRSGLHVVRAWLQMGRFQQACDAYLGILCDPLIVNLEAYAEVLSIERPFFRLGWDSLPDCVEESSAAHLALDAARALKATGNLKEALAVESAAIFDSMRRENWSTLPRFLIGVANVFIGKNRIAKLDCLTSFSLELASLTGDKQDMFLRTLDRFTLLAGLGRVDEAEAAWELLRPMGQVWHTSAYRPGRAESHRAQFEFDRGTLKEELLTNAERLAKQSKDRGTIRDLHVLRGDWCIEQGQAELAAESFSNALRMAREVGQSDMRSEAQLALAKLHLGQLPDARLEAERLSKTNETADLVLSELWLAIGDHERAKNHAIEAYKWAWADGEPYVHRYELNKARALLERLGSEIPKLPPYDPDKNEKFPWEDELVATIERLRAEKGAKNPNKT